LLQHILLEVFGIYNSLLEDNSRFMSDYIHSDPFSEESLRDRSRSALGSVLLFLGIGLLSLLAADRTFGLPVKLPRSWYTDRGLWVACGLFAFGAGWYLLGDRKSADDAAGTEDSGENRRKGEPSGIRFERIVLYTRPGCHLCELARETLEKHQDSLPPPIEINIDTDPTLQARFSTCIPVVEIDGKIRFRGRVNEVLLRRLIAATPPKIAG
jgi:hypothetical protein